MPFYCVYVDFYHNLGGEGWVELVAKSEHEAMYLAELVVECEPVAVEEVSYTKRDLEALGQATMVSDHGN